MSVIPSTASQLRREINARAEAFARDERLLHDIAPGTSPAIVFGRDDAGRHGNFHPASDAAICVTPDWLRRLSKPHTASRRSIARKDWRWMELDAAVSSDALLMSVFCHPGVYSDHTLAAPVAALFGVDTQTSLCFGALPGVPLRTTRKRRGSAAPKTSMVDRTEVDLAFGDPPHQLFLEAKLTESDFQTATPKLLERYRDFEAVFDLSALPHRLLSPPPLPENVDPDDPTVNLPRRTGTVRIAGYQLIRNVLAAYAANASFCVILDARRTDLIEQWYSVLLSVHAPDFRWRLKLLTWQELAAVLPRDLRSFLDRKYGIRGETAGLIATYR
ncbi:MAG: hypothetical protein NVSMB62_15610 [Acidobacteriaceae bacterium]